MNGRLFSQRDIDMALDGELPVEERAQFDAWLAANPDMKARKDRLADDMTRLREAVAGIVDEPVPDRLVAVLKSGRPTRWGLWRAAAAAAILVVGGIAGYAVGSGLLFGDGPEEWLAEQAIGAYATYPADLPHTVEVGGEDKDYLDRWLSKRTGLKVVAPDLSGQGFELLGGRILPGGQAPAALLVYKNQAGNQLSIYMTPQPGDNIRGTYAAEEGGPNAIYWLDKGFGCAIVSNLSQDQMRDVARSAWRQLLAAADA
ncbi:MAG TPA: anti-sigma factor [Rhizobiaceae bacterium]|nr:anti-sigma factor [Rhizobiaceae bacterium]